MKSTKFREVLARIPEDVKERVRLSFDFTERMLDIMEHKKITHEYLAEKLEIELDTLYDWLTGTYDFTIHEIVKIEIILGEKIIYVHK